MEKALNACCGVLGTCCSLLCGPCIRRKKTLGNVPPFLVALLIFWLYFSWIEAIGLPLFGVKDGTFLALFFFVSLSGSFVLLVTSFYFAYKLTPPPPSPEMLQLVQTGFVKACRKCNDPKPARTHHCSTCEKCIPRMDHHCIWVGNCVGQHNHKHFILFLFYVCFTCGQAVITWFLTPDVDFSPQAFLVGIFCFILTITIGIFGIFHIFMVCANKTSLECLDKCCSNDKSDYDRGFKANWCEIMGDDPYYWLLPTNIPKPFLYRDITDNV